MLYVTYEPDDAVGTFFPQVSKDGGIAVHAFVSTANPFLFGAGIIKRSDVNIQRNQISQTGGNARLQGS